jgi:hypothetical protein
MEAGALLARAQKSLYSARLKGADAMATEADI